MVKEIRIIKNSSPNNWFKIGETYTVYEEDGHRYFTHKTDRHFWITKECAEEVIKELLIEIW